MIKKLFLITAALILAVSCSKSPTNPNGSGNTGDGGIIDGGSGTSDPTAISEFLKQYTGRYYQEYSSGSIYVEYRIENGELYESYNSTPVNGTRTLSGNKLQIESQDNYGNDEITILNFINDNIYKYYKSIYKKESFSEQSGFIKVGNPISTLSQYSGSYYTSYIYENQEEKYYSLLIGNDGQVYFQNPTDNGIPIYNFKTVNFANNIISISMSYSYQGESAEITITYLIKDGRLIDSDQYMNGQLQSIELKKSDLINDYIGTSYSSADGITLKIYQDYVSIIGSIEFNGSAILIGNTMTIFQYVESSRTYKRHTIVFSDDKQKATYTKPDNGGTVELTKQGA